MQSIAKSKQTIAAFDFDKTITKADSLLFFLLYTFGFVKTIVGIFLHIPYFILFKLGILSRQSCKERVLSWFLKGMDLRALEKSGRLFAAQFPQRLLRADAITKIQWHQSQGHRCVLVSANLDIYLKPWTELYGFNACLSSSLEAIDNRLTGRLKGKNCWGEEKVKRLYEYLGNLDQWEIWAYGDSLGDKELLEIANHKFYRTF